jgi:hypothetical protein
MSSSRALTATAASTRSAQSPQALRRQVPKAYVPGANPRKSAKVLDSGARSEHRLELWGNLDKSQACWRRCGVRGVRNSGLGLVPDAAGYSPALNGLTEIHDAAVAGRPGYNFVLSFKSQHVTGSAAHKIVKEITDLGSWCDVQRTVAAVILDTPILSAGEIAEFRAHGRQQSVAVLTADELKAGALTGELIRVAKERRRLYGRTSERGKYFPTKAQLAHEMAYVNRQQIRRQVAKALGQSTYRVF